MKAFWKAKHASTRMKEEMVSKPWKVDDDDSYSIRSTNVSCYDRKFVCKIKKSAALTRHLQGNVDLLNSCTKT
jgi:hypothetical protein